MPKQCHRCEKWVMRRPPKGDEFIPVVGVYTCADCMKDACPHCGSFEQGWKGCCAECDPICEECGDFINNEKKSRGDRCAECDEFHAQAVKKEHPA
jgi:hypothetical protein